jgi:hypothetical protein
LDSTGREGIDDVADMDEMALVEKYQAFTYGVPQRVRPIYEAECGAGRADPDGLPYFVLVFFSGG